MTRTQATVGAAALLAVAVPVAILTYTANRVPGEPSGGVMSIPPVVRSGDPRPIFGSGFDDPSVPDVVAGTSGDAPVLVGIVGRLPDAAVALVRGPDGRSKSVAIGEESGGWRLEGLVADQAVFRRGGQRVRVRLAPADEPEPEPDPQTGQ